MNVRIFPSMSISVDTKIRIRMLELGMTNTQSAREFGVTRQYISLVIHGRRIGKRIRKALCDRLGLPMSIWDEEMKDKAA